MPQTLAQNRMNFLQMLAQNPRGWGPSAPGAPGAPEHGADDQEAEAKRRRFIQLFGVDPSLPSGQFAGETAKNFLSQAATQALPAALGPVGRVAGPALRAAALPAALLGFSSQAGLGSESPLQELLKQRGSLDRQRALAVEERDAQVKGEGGRSAGRGPIYDGKDLEVRRLTDEMQGIDAMISEANKQSSEASRRSSPEYQMELQKKAQELDVERKAKEAATPFRQKYPDTATALAWGGSTAAVGLPFLLRGKANLGTVLPGNIVSRINSTVKAAKKAIDGGSIDKARLYALELKHLIAGGPKAAKSTSGVANAATSVMDVAAKVGRAVGKPLAAAASGGVLAAEGSLLPDQIDMSMLPEGPARDRSRAIALDPKNYVERAITGSLTGFGGYKAGGLVPAREANVAGAKAIIEFLGKRAPKAVAPRTGLGAKRVTRKPRGKAND